MYRMAIRLLILGFICELAVQTVYTGEGWNCCTNQTVYRQLDNSLQTVVWSQEDIISNVSNARCAFKCSRGPNPCKAIAIDNKDNCLLLSDVSEVSTETWSLAGKGWKVYHPENVQTQFPIFRISKGSGHSVNNTWLTASPSSLDDASLTTAFDLRSPLTSFYKHPLLNEWHTWNVQEVSMYLYTAGERVAELQFKAVHSVSSTSWFSLDNLINSPWTDLVSGTGINYFSFSGFLERRFYINSKHGGCPSDAGWLMVLDKADICPAYIFSSNYPVFNYAHGQYKQHWVAGNISSADDLIVFAKVQL